jgi:hypothetical protein
VQVSSTAAFPGDSLHAAQLANGGHVVVWSSAAGTTPSQLFAQMFDVSGAKVGEPVSVFGPSSFYSHGVVGLPDGSFLVSGSSTIIEAASNTPHTRLYVQKVSGSGQLLPTGGVSDVQVNGGLADRLLSADLATTVDFWGGPFFINPDGGYVLAVRSDSRPIPQQFIDESLLNVDSTGNVVGAPVELGGEGFGRPAIARLGGGNLLFARTDLVAGPGVFVFAPVSWQIVTNTGQVIAQQTLGANTSSPQVTELADGTGLLVWSDPAAQGLLAERIDGSGNVLGTATMPSNAGSATALAGGGFVFTWTSGSQILAQYFTNSGTPQGASFVVADNVDTGTSIPWYWIDATTDGFIAVYQTAGKQIYEVRFNAAGSV